MALSVPLGHYAATDDYHTYEPTPSAVSRKDRNLDTEMKFLNLEMSTEIKNQTNENTQQSKTNIYVLDGSTGSPVVTSG